MHECCRLGRYHKPWPGHKQEGIVCWWQFFPLLLEIFEDIKSNVDTLRSAPIFEKCSLCIVHHMRLCKQNLTQAICKNLRCNFSELLKNWDWTHFRNKWSIILLLRDHWNIAFLHEGRVWPLRKPHLWGEWAAWATDLVCQQSHVRSRMRSDETPSYPAAFSDSAWRMVLSTSLHSTGPTRFFHIFASIFFAFRLYIEFHHLGNTRDFALNGLVRFSGFGGGSCCM